MSSTWSHDGFTLLWHMFENETRRPFSGYVQVARRTTEDWKEMEEAASNPGINHKIPYKVMVFFFSASPLCFNQNCPGFCFILNFQAPPFPCFL
jgi:hypothetical protein